jgi:two-component system phosphate regulon sensor histidine kinase PhoR
MKTPLATIYSVLTQFKNGTVNKNPELRQKFCTIAIEQAVNLQSVVNQILTLAYIKKKQLALNKQLIDLPEMIQSLIDNFTVRTEKIVAFQTCYNLEDNNVYADSLYLNNAISNLIDNAIKYSSDSVDIKIECTTKESQVYIHVKDNGFGISSNDRLKIFKQFERGAEIKRNQISGFGIGLNYVQSVIEAHGGTVTLSSQEGVGSEFTIILPLCYSNVNYIHI